MPHAAAPAAEPHLGHPLPRRGAVAQIHVLHQLPRPRVHAVVDVQARTQLHVGPLRLDALASLEARPRGGVLGNAVPRAGRLVNDPAAHLHDDLPQRVFSLGGLDVELGLVEHGAIQVEHAELLRVVRNGGRAARAAGGATRVRRMRGERMRAAGARRVRVASECAAGRTGAPPGCPALPGRLHFRTVWLPSVCAALKPPHGPKPSQLPSPSHPGFRAQAVPRFRSVYASKPFAPPVARPQAVPHSPVVLRSLVAHVPKPPTLPGPSRPALPGHSRPVRLPACAFVRFLPAFHYDARRRAGKREPGFAAQISESRKGKQDRWHKAKRARTRGERGKGAAGDGHGKRLHPNRHAGKQRKPAPAAPFPSTPRRHASCKTRAGGSAFAGGAAVFG